MNNINNAKKHIEQRITELNEGIKKYNTSNSLRTRRGHCYWTYGVDYTLEELHTILEILNYEEPIDTINDLNNK